MARTKAADRIGPGDRFGRLTVETDTGVRKNRYVVWRCRCDCGNTIDVDVRTLKRGTVQDCGCVSGTRESRRDITGQRFGKLIARYPTGETVPNRGAVWHCDCDCGGTVDVALSQLVYGFRKSCGCLSHPPLKDFVGKRFGKLTVTDYAGKYSSVHHWKCQCDCGKTTVVGQTSLQNGETQSCGCLRASVYRENLKLVDGTSVTVLESVRCRRYSNNTSGYTGVYSTRGGKWCAQISLQGKTYHLGTFTKKEDAVRARQRGEQIHKDFIDWYYAEYMPAQREGQKTFAPYTGAQPECDRQEEATGKSPSQHRSTESNSTLQ